MKKIMCALLALACAGIAAPVMADPGKDESGHGKHRHKHERRDRDYDDGRRREADVVVVRPRSVDITIEGPSVVVKPPRIVVE